MNNQHIKLYILCAFSICINTILGSIITYSHIPLLYLDSIGTIFISVNFDLKYGILTGLGTNIFLTLIHGPLALPFGLVNITIAIITHVCSKKGFNYRQAILTGIIITLVSSFVSATIRIILYSGFSNSITDYLILSLRISGMKIFFSAYIGAVVDSILDKILICLFVCWISNLSVIHNYILKTKQI